MERRLIKHFSYPCTTSIMRFSRMAKRSQMSRSKNGLKKVEKTVPYFFDNVVVTFDRVELRQGPIIYEWFFEDSDPGFCAITFTAKRRTDFKDEIIHSINRRKLKGTMSSKIDKLLKTYIKEGTSAFNIGIHNDPPAGLPYRIFAKNIFIDLKTELPDFNGWKPVFRGIRNDTKVVFFASEHSHKLICLLQTSDFQRSRELEIEYDTTQFRRHQDLFHEDDMQIVQLELPSISLMKGTFPSHKFEKMIYRWIERHRPIGTVFSMILRRYSKVLDCFDLCTKQFNGVLGKHEFKELGEHSKRHSVLIPVDDTRQILIHALPADNTVEPLTGYKWQLKIVVLPLDKATDRLPDKPILFNSKSELSSSCLKSILQHTKIAKRELLCRFIPNLQKHNAQVPYKFDKIEISDSSLKLEDGNFSAEFAFHKISDNQDWNIIQTCNGKDNVYYLPEPDEDPQRRLTKEILMKRLFDKYLISGMRADTIRAVGWRPSALEYKQLKTGTIIGDFSCPNEFFTWWPFFDTSGFKVFQFEMRYVSNKWSRVFHSELTRKSQKVIFHYNEENKEHFPIEKMFYLDADFPFYEITCDYSYKSNKLEQMILMWWEFKRPIGASFSMLVDQHKGILEVFDKIQRRLNGVRSVFPEVSGPLKHCICISMSDEKEIVVFAEKSTIPKFTWKLKIVVMPAGSTEPARPESILDFSEIDVPAIALEDVTVPSSGCFLGFSLRYIIIQVVLTILAFSFVTVYLYFTLTKDNSKKSWAS